MKKSYFICICLILFLMTGCASKTTYTNSQYKKATESNVRVISGSLDAVWHAAITGLSKDFFVLDNIEKNSKIITLSYAIDNPEPYVDCGNVTVTVSGGMSGNGTFVFPSARKMVT